MSGSAEPRDPVKGRDSSVRRHPAVSGRGGGGPGAKRQQFRPDVEGLRAVAIVLVVLYHVHASLVPGGYVGVDVFFVISGFLITGQLVRELRTNGRISFLAFYARRARRILPAAVLTLVVTAVASALLLIPSPPPAPWTTSCRPSTSGRMFTLRLRAPTISTPGFLPRRSRTSGPWRLRSSSTSSGRCCWSCRLWCGFEYDVGLAASELTGP